MQMWLMIINALSFKYKASIINNTGANGTKNGVKIAVPLKYLSNFWRSLEMLLINWTFIKLDQKLCAYYCC